ncbi:unnamed protein product [Symbiodinium pilosum]|uniref:Uncharacterized protein n=1 Tax=Symbiodinium pilosum TaxID=2952 RepID=A0A812QMW5_SYMPI|nr:unnamed protein product [Symbiodinium pilosum]
MSDYDKLKLIEARVLHCGARSFLLALKYPTVTKRPFAERHEAVTLRRFGSAKGAFARTVTASPFAAVGMHRSAFDCQAPATRKQIRQLQAASWLPNFMETLPGFAVMPVRAL